MNLRILPFLILPLACASRNEPARESPHPEAEAPVVVHADLGGNVRYVKHTSERTADGRLSVRVILASHASKELTLVAFTDWLDDDGNVVERSSSRTVVLPSGQTYVFEDSSYSTNATRFGVSLRPATTKRKR